MPYTVRYHDVDYGNGGAVRTGVLGCFVTKKIANNVARDHFGGWVDEFSEYVETVNLGQVYAEEFTDGMIDIDALTPEGLIMRAWVERATSSARKRKANSGQTQEYLVKSEDVDYRNPRGNGAYDVQSNVTGPYHTLEEASEAVRAHFRRSGPTGPFEVREYTEDSIPGGLLIVSAVVDGVNLRAWVEVRVPRSKTARSAAILPADATQCPYCGRAAESFPTGLSGLSRHVRLCPSKSMMANSMMPKNAQLIAAGMQVTIPQQQMLAPVVDSSVMIPQPVPALATEPLVPPVKGGLGAIQQSLQPEEPVQAPQLAASPEPAGGQLPSLANYLPNLVETALHHGQSH